MDSHYEGYGMNNGFIKEVLSSITIRLVIKNIVVYYSIFIKTTAISMFSYK